MARARNIKPGFFKNEELANLSFQARLLFIGLWTLADRDGYLEDRPKRIKMELFPMDDMDVNSYLVDLSDSGFIIRYKTQGLPYIFIPSFTKHQNPHYKEKASTIPKPEDCTGQEQGVDCNKYIEKPEASPRLEQVLPSSSPADSLIPDSLIPDSKEAADAGGNPPSFDDVIWKTGLQILMAQGNKEQPARGFLGKLISQYGKDAVARAMVDSASFKPQELKAYLVKVLAGPVQQQTPTPPRRKPMPMPGPRKPKPEGMDFNV